MASYETWNRAIIDHFTVGISLGSMVYLSIDEEIIAQIGQRIGLRDEGRADPLADFRRAVRERVVLESRRVRVRSLTGYTDAGFPQGVAFLATLVLSASKMANEDLADDARIDELDFFQRLRGLLDLERIRGRPEGFATGDEEPLWRDWNAWLQAQGFISTARRGKRNRTYVQYAIGQTLLRQADKDRLRGIFNRLRWQADLDGETVLIQLRSVPDLLKSRYLLDVLSRPGPRYQALSDLLYDLYASWRESPNDTADGSRTTNATLRCGLLRQYDAIFGALSYRLYPRTPATRHITEGHILQGSDQYPLVQDRPGWFAALNDVSNEELTNGTHFPVTGIEGVTRAVLPQRSFWVLVPDPEEPDSGFYASWRHPTLGEPAIVLITEGALPLLYQLRAEGLVQWDGDPRPVTSLDGAWLEVCNCLVTSEAHGGVFGEEQALFEELRPATKLGISTRGGLRSPDRRGWIAGHGPCVTVSGFESEVEFRITRVEDDAVIEDRTIACMTPQDLPITTPGIYRIDAMGGGHEATPRLVRLVNWEQLISADDVDYSFVVAGETKILGATLSPASLGGA